MQSFLHLGSHCSIGIQHKLKQYPVSKLITRFDTDLEILVVEPEKSLEAGFIKEYYNYLERDESLPRNLRSLCITKATKYPVGTKDVNELVETLALACKKYNSIKEAFLVEDPYMTVITTLFSEKADFPNYMSKIFSTEAAAIKWLLQ